MSSSVEILGGLTLPSKVYYERDDKGKAAMFKYISSIISLLGEEKGKHAQDIHRLIEFESILANIRYGKVSNTYRKTFEVVIVSSVREMIRYPDGSCQWIGWMIGLS